MWMTTNARRRLLLGVLPLVIIILAWEWSAASSTRIAFLLGRPSEAGSILWRRVIDGTLVTDLTVTVSEAILGFIIGNAVGVALGLVLWRWSLLDHTVRPYLIALGAVPVFSLGPVLVVWFGTGLASKIVLVFLSTVLVATSNAHAGASEIRPELFRLFRSWGAADKTIFRMLVMPSAAVWVFAGLRLNIGFALLGAFVAEFIASESGLAHRILIDGGLYNISAVWVGVLSFAIVALVLGLGIGWAERVLTPWRTRQDLWTQARVMLGSTRVGG